MKAEGMSLDRISILPQPILETILGLLPTEEAARTSILSREWRYKWTAISKLWFNLRKSLSTKNMDMHDVYQILLRHHGPIHELTLKCHEITLEWRESEDYCLELDQIILQLSMNHTVRKLTLSGWDFYDRGCEVPKSLFSFHHLKHLEISFFDLYHPPIFNGFDSLESLCLTHVVISTKILLHLLSNCPSLKSLTLFVCESDDKCTISELLGCLPVIEHLTTSPDVSQVRLDSVPQELPTSLIYLRYLCFEDMAFVERRGLDFLLVFIKCSPNLEKIKLEIDQGVICYGTYSFAWEKYSDVWLEHLNDLEIDGFNNSKPEMDFVKFILARSPKLKKVSISCMRRVGHRIEMEMLKTLLEAPRVSPVVITVK